MNIGLMQGRLIPQVFGQLQAFPAELWNGELMMFEKYGIDCIEWIYDGEYFDFPNPISSFDGARDIGKMRYPSPIAFSLCADYFVKTPLLRVPESTFILEERLDRLEWLILQCRLAHIPILVLPFVDDNSIRNDSELYAVSDMMHSIGKLAKACDVIIALETNLSPGDTQRLLYKCPRHICINYDTGNSASLGYKMEEEWNAYGEVIANVHIKDRLLNGGSVPLGEGCANFDMLAKMLDKFEYNGNLILQVARGESGKEVEWYHKNRNFLLDRGIG